MKEEIIKLKTYRLSDLATRQFIKDFIVFKNSVIVLFQMYKK